MAATELRQRECGRGGVIGGMRAALLASALAVLPGAGAWAEDAAPTVDQDMAGVPDPDMSGQAQSLLVKRSVSQPAKVDDAAGTSPNSGANLASVAASGQVASADQRLDADSSVQE